MLGLVLGALSAPLLSPPPPPPSPPPVVEPPPVRVFLLVGQSNMEGQAVVDLDHPEHYNGGRGTLVDVLRRPEIAARFGHLRAGEAWAEREDVRVWYQPERGDLKAGPLSIGYAVYGGRHHFGPELQIGHRLGDAVAAPVLLVKAAWGGKSLHVDFRPPSAGGTPGPYFAKTLAAYRAALVHAEAHVAAFAGRRFELSGAFWFQGWNDMVDAEATAAYERNLIHWVDDLRAALDAESLPVVIAETGHCGNQDLRRAQAAVAEHPPFAGSVAFVPTAAFLRDKDDSPNTGHGHHWFGNAESFLWIGDAMGAAMVELLADDGEASSGAGGGDGRVRRCPE